jgi:hypothetical protein
MAAADLYEADAVAWAEMQAEALRRAAAAGSNLPLDFEHLAQEVEELALREDVPSGKKAQSENLRADYSRTPYQVPSDQLQRSGDRPTSSLRGPETSRQDKALSWSPSIVSRLDLAPVAYFLSVLRDKSVCSLSDSMLKFTKIHLVLALHMHS